MPDTGRESTWISDDMKVAYIQMYHDGIAHSVETWMEGQLVGGIYGLSIGKMFFGESMFSLVPDASKTALIMLCRQLNDWGFELIDCQVGNPHLLRMGAKEIERVEFEARLKIAVEQHHPDDFWKQGINTGRDW